MAFVWDSLAALLNREIAHFQRNVIYLYFDANHCVYVLYTVGVWGFILVLFVRESVS